MELKYSIYMGLFQGKRSLFLYQVQICTWYKFKLRICGLYQVRICKYRLNPGFHEGVAQEFALPLEGLPGIARILHQAYFFV